MSDIGLICLLLYLLALVILLLGLISYYGGELSRQGFYF